MNLVALEMPNHSELDFHKTVKSTSMQIYTEFEENHLTDIIEAFKNNNDSRVETHYSGVQSTLLEFETKFGTIPTIRGTEVGHMTERGVDAIVLSSLKRNDRAQKTVLRFSKSFIFIFVLCLCYHIPDTV